MSMRYNGARAACPPALETEMNILPVRPIPGIIEWLVGNESHDLDDAGLMAGLGRRLRSGGVPVDRVTLHLRTLHPEILGRVLAWAPDEPVEVYDREHGVLGVEQFAGSPVRWVMEHREWLTVAMGDAAARWRHLDIFEKRGLAEILLAPLFTGDGPASAVGFGTRRPQGFSPAERAALERLVPALRAVWELRVLRQIEATLLDTYVGTATGRRILAGRIRRGDVESLEAALLLCDLRGFTALSERLPGARVLELLNLYFDQVVPAILEHGGEILKFMGDAVLAFFHRDAGPEASCAAAFAAAEASLRNLATVREPDAELLASIALHHGEVSYGNIGSAGRLDFTVIGRDVNLTSRIEGASSSTGRPILMSERFVQLLGRPGAVSAGRHPLKGFAEPVELFAWPAPAALEVRR